MSRYHVELDDETRDVLERSKITQNALTLPGHLDRGLYERVNKVLVIAGGKWNRSAKAHLFESDPRAILGLAIEGGEILDVKKATQAFYTPPLIAEKVVEYADVDGRTVLEPSAGQGTIALECLVQGALSVTCVELDKNSMEHLKGFRAFNADFMEWQEVGVPFERVVMNPPFTGGQDIKHVTRAFSMLAPSGILVAIMAPGFTFRSDKASVAFRALLEEHGETVEELPEGTFAESGTQVRTVIVRLRN